MSLTPTPGLRKPTPDDKVYRDECMFSFDSPFSPEGVFVNLHTFQCFGQSFLELDRSRGGQLYLNIKSTKVVVPADVAAAAAPVTKLAIGTAGGFQTGEDTVTSVTAYQLVQFPGPLVVPYPSEEVPAAIAAVVDAVIAHTDANVEAAVGWEDKPKVTAFYASLIQLPDAPKVSPNPKDWRCALCDKTENLWLNLSDSFIGCGRRNYDGSGGNGHALQHFNDTGRLYPLCVKLGTITPKGGDVYSYHPDENDMVEDPNLAQHLSGLGISMMCMEKTEKSMAELSISLNLEYDWSKITMADGREAPPRRGPGFMGLTNTGNSCYVNSVLQLLFANPEFVSRYCAPAEAIFAGAPASSADDLVTQLAKVAVALVTDRYVHAPVPEGEKQPEDTVAPTRLRNLVGRGHAEFSTSKQQDALEYLQHLLSAIRRSERNSSDAGAGAGDVSKLFDFTLQEKLKCMQSGKFRLRSIVNNVLSLSIPVERAVNASAVEEYQLQSRIKKQKAQDGGVQESEDKPVLLQVSFEAVLDGFSEPESITDFLSPATGSKGLAVKNTYFSSFPRLLAVSLRRYVLGADWLPVKLDALVPVPEHLNLEHLRGPGLLPGEDALLESSGPGAAATAPAALVPSADIIDSLCSMGFSANAAARAALAVGNSGSEAASEWLFGHLEDADINDPPAPAPASASASAAAPAAGPAADPELVATVMSMGFEAKYAELGLKETGGSLERAMDWLFSRSIPEMDALLTSGSAPTAAAASSVAAAGGGCGDGPGVYDLVGFVTHQGRNTGSGHYVAHLNKEGAWTFFNDSHVVFCDSPPLGVGYVYLYRRRD